MTFLVGAYAAAPAEPASDEFGEFFSAIADHPLIGGLELSSQHLGDPAAAAAIAESVGQEWVYAVTCFPGTMFCINDNPATGLASTDQAGRAAALRFVDGVRADIAAFDATVGGGRVQKLFLHTAPRGGTPEALADSLTELAGWDWGSVGLHLEHCDAAVPDHAPQKGLLSLADELAVLEQFPDIGMVINWGRSAIETESIAGPLQHLSAARQAARLTGVMFSGAAASDGDFGPAWLDAHLPTSSVTADSLLTPTAIASSLQAAGDSVFLGAKVGVRPLDATVAQRVSVIDRVLSDLDDAASATGAGSRTGAEPS